MLSHLYSNEHWSVFNVLPGSLHRALDAARRAVDAAPFNHLPYWALALFFRRDFASFRPAAERAIALNPMDGSTVAFMGQLIAYSGDWETGCSIAEPASAPNSNHAGWHRVLPFYNAYRKGEYREALAAGLRLNAPASLLLCRHACSGSRTVGQARAGAKCSAGITRSQGGFCVHGARQFRENAGCATGRAPD